jgi:hypothetical protein
VKIKAFTCVNGRSYRNNDNLWSLEVKVDQRIAPIFENWFLFFQQGWIG